MCGFMFMGWLGFVCVMVRVFIEKWFELTRKKFYDWDWVSTSIIRIRLPNFTVGFQVD